MNKKIYVQPSLEVLPIGTMQTLCASEGGGDPETMGRAPRNTEVF